MSARFRRIRRILIGVLLVLAAWAASVEALTFLQPPGQPVAVVARGGMQGALAAVIAANGYVLQVRGDTVIAISDEEGFVPRLYRSGAMFVVLARTGGCIVASGERA
jgi:hypothetical protein